MQSQKNKQISESTDSATSAVAAQEGINMTDNIKNHAEFRNGHQPNT